jgi:hypothetical protein
MSSPKSYRTYADFEREEIRPSFKVGFSMEDMVEEATFENSLIDWDKDPFELEEELPADAPALRRQRRRRRGPDGRTPGTSSGFWACIET